MEPTGARVTRVCVVQAIIPHYRVPLFEGLARRPELRVTLWAGTRSSGSLANTAGDGAYLLRRAPVHGRRGLFVQPQRLVAAARGAFDVLVLPWNLRYLDLLPTLGLARARGLSTLLWGHGYSKKESTVRRRARNAVGRLADGCMFYSRTAADRCIAEGFDPERVFVAPNALDQRPIQAASERCRAATGALAALRRERGLTEGQTVFFSARLEPDKRVDLLLEAFALCRRGRPQARLVIVGAGSAETRLQRRARSLGLDDATLFVGALYDEEQLAPWFLASSVAAFPAALGLSIHHAFGYGLPVITSDDFSTHGPEIEALRVNENGLTFRDGDPVSLAEQLGRVLDDRELQRTLAVGAAATVSGPRGYTMERLVGGFSDALIAVDRRHKQVRR